MLLSSKRKLNDLVGTWYAVSVCEDGIEKDCNRNLKITFNKNNSLVINNGESTKEGKWESGRIVVNSQVKLREYQITFDEDKAWGVIEDGNLILDSGDRNQYSIKFLKLKD